MIFLFPTVRPVTVLNMNCMQYLIWSNVDAVVVMAGVGLFAFVWWWAGARHYCESGCNEELIVDIGPRTYTHVTGTEVIVTESNQKV